MMDLGPLPTAKSLIQSLLLAADDRAHAARQLVAACALFNLTENNVRVALVRLQNEGIIEAEGRGYYRLGPAAKSLAQEVAAWRSVEERLTPWDGHYLVVYCGNLGRSDRGTVNRRTMALKLQGFAELEKGLFVRPDNLAGSIGETRIRLKSLGLEDQALIFRADDWDATQRNRLSQLWQNSDLNSLYKQRQQQLDAWLANAHKLDAAQAAREAFLLGRPAIRQVIYDPLLPDTMIDAPARRACFETIRRFDNAGRAIWFKFFQFSETHPDATGAI